MFYVRYLFAELRRRWGRTFLTAAGLGVGVALVVATTAFSAGLKDAQDDVLAPLTGVGTDMTVSRPLTIDEDDSGFTDLSEEEREQLEEENGGGRIAFDELGEPGEKFSNDSLVSGSQLSFSSDVIQEVSAISGVEKVTGSLTLTNMHTSGTVPDISEGPQFGVSHGSEGDRGEARELFGNMDIEQFTVAGIDASQTSLLPVSATQVTDGEFLDDSDARAALLSTSYAEEQDLSVGDTIEIGGKKFTIVGLVKHALGAAASDVYVNLTTLQKISDREGRVNTLSVRASSTDDVASVAEAIPQVFSGAEVSTAEDLAEQVQGSLVDASNLVDRLGFVLKIVGLGAAFLIASFLTLSSVAKRVRELGTLKAIGWSQSRVVRQVTAESVAQGLFGGAVGAALAAAGIAAFNATGITLQATVAAAPQTAGGGPGFGPPGAFGLGRASTVSGATDVVLQAPFDLNVVLVAVALALLGGLIAGGAGGLRAARLRPAQALQTVG
ncbi:MAG: FtsX-like permease family protein [Actinobacteria bacterium]|nr:FtsX-like permease family protein [Actinomycetota bacterium]